jgi:hypothetical protein
MAASRLTKALSANAGNDNLIETILLEPDGDKLKITLKGDLAVNVRARTEDLLIAAEHTAKRLLDARAPAKGRKRTSTCFGFCAGGCITVWTQHVGARRAIEPQVVARARLP